MALHKDVLHAFTQAWQAGRLPHAWLLTGPRGVGKRTACRHMAAQVLASNPSSFEAVYRAICQGTHPEVFSLPEEDPLIPIQTIRQLKEYAQKTTFTPSWRVIFLFNAHRLNAASANALLKLLEEPPKQTLFLLTTPHPGRLPATILSRCYRWVLKPLPFEAFCQMFPQTDPVLLYQLSQGCPGRAKALLDTPLGKHSHTLWHALTDALQTPGMLPPALVSFFAENLQDFEDILFLWFHHHSRILCTPQGHFGMQTILRLLEECRTYNLDARFVIQEIYAIISAELAAVHTP